MNKRYTNAPLPRSLEDIQATDRVGNVTFDPAARNEAGQIIITEDWAIVCAPRPIPGTISWTNAGTFPMFWAAIDLTSEFGPGYYARCEELDATELIYISKEDVLTRTQTYYDQKMPGRVNVYEHPYDKVWTSFVKFASKQDHSSP